MGFDLKDLVDKRVRAEIQRMWELMVAESMRLSGSNTPGVVTRPGYREIHVRLSLVLSEDEQMELEEADHVAFRDWGEDIVAFGGDSGVDLKDIWLEDVKDKLREAVQRTGCTIKQLCNKYDADGSGDLDFDEFVQIIRVDCYLTEKNLHEDELRSLFKTIDEDGSGEVNAAELESLLEENEALKQPMTFEIFMQSMCQ